MDKRRSASWSPGLAGSSATLSLDKNAWRSPISAMSTCLAKPDLVLDELNDWVRALAVELSSVSCEYRHPEALVGTGWWVGFLLKVWTRNRIKRIRSKKEKKPALYLVSTPENVANTLTDYNQDPDCVSEIRTRLGKDTA